MTELILSRRQLIKATLAGIGIAALKPLEAFAAIPEPEALKRYWALDKTMVKTPTPVRSAMGVLISSDHVVVHNEFAYTDDDSVGPGRWAPTCGAIHFRVADLHAVEIAKSDLPLGSLVYIGSDGVVRPLAGHI